MAVVVVVLVVMVVVLPCPGWWWWDSLLWSTAGQFREALDRNKVVEPTGAVLTKEQII